MTEPILACRACDRELPEGASFCPACGAARGFDRPVELETCEIVLWRGYLKAGFYAVPTTAGAEPAEGALGSPLFRAKKGQLPAEEGKAREAHAALVERILAEGWEPVGRGSTWYSQVFARPRVGHALDVDLAKVVRARSLPAVESAPAEPAEPSLPPDEGRVILEKDPLPPPRVESPPPAPAPPPVEAPAPQERLSPEPSPGREVAVRAATEVDETPESEWLETEVVPRRKRQRLRVGLASLAALVVGIAAALGPSLLKSEPATGSSTPKRTAQPVSKPDVKPKAKPKTARPVPKRPVSVPLAHVVLSATRGDSWAEARVGSATGRVLYTGMLTQGQTTRVSARRVWLRLAAAAHVDVLVNGKPPKETLLGTVDVVLGPR